MDIIEKYQKTIFRFANSHIRYLHSELNDLIQECNLVVWENRKNINDDNIIRILKDCFNRMLMEERNTGFDSFVYIWNENKYENRINHSDTEDDIYITGSPHQVYMHEYYLKHKENYNPERQSRNWKRYYEKHREKILQKNREYFEKHKDKKKEYYRKRKEWFDALPEDEKEKILTVKREKAREYYADHKEEINRKRRENYPKTRDTQKEYNKMYYEQHKEQIKAKSKEYYHRKKEAE